MPNFLLAHPLAVIALLIVVPGLVVALSAIFRKSYKLTRLPDIPKSFFGDASTTKFSSKSLHLVESKRDAQVWPGHVKVEEDNYMCHANERLVCSLPERSPLNLMAAYIFTNRATGVNSLIVKGTISQPNSLTKHNFFWVGATTRSGNPEITREKSWNIKERFWYSEDMSDLGTSNTSENNSHSDEESQGATPNSTSQQ